MNPYEVLGVSPNATDDEVKTAYRELARKYHPDHYQNNPLSDLATEKMKEINDAYDQVMAARRAGGAGGASGTQTTSQYADIRRLINSRRITEAEELLDGVPKQARNAEWYFLKGTVQHSRGWLDEAYENISRACSMDPNSAEYRSALNQLQWQRQSASPGYRPHGAGGGRQRNTAAGCGICDVCATLYCADCCCECMGGDFIRCC